jgi:citrate lyase subunit beta/citryl-CoA lyase
VLAKAESPADVRRTSELLGRGVRIVPMVESASSLEQAEGIARHSATFRIAFGVGDFRRDTGVSADPIALAPVRSRLVVASVAAGIRPPIDGPTHGSADAVLAGVAHGRAMGMTGALVLDAARLPVVHEALSPSAAELAWARDVLSDDGPRDGAYAPALARANAVLTLHEQLGGGQE